MSNQGWISTPPPPHTHTHTRKHTHTNTHKHTPRRAFCNFSRTLLTDTAYLIVGQVNINFTVFNLDSTLEKLILNLCNVSPPDLTPPTLTISQSIQCIATCSLTTQTIILKVLGNNFYLIPMDKSQDQNHGPASVSWFCGAQTKIQGISALRDPWARAQIAHTVDPGLVKRKVSTRPHRFQ